jgi:hypothetical protein
MRPRSGVQARSRRVTLIEVTVACAAAVTLMLVLTPSIADVVNDARIARAHSDCAAIARAIVRFHDDTGVFPRRMPIHPATSSPTPEHLTLLVGPGRTPAGDTSDGALQGWLIPSGEASTGPLADHLLTNAPGYPRRESTATVGWNGPYLASVVATDPWNNRYMVNIGAAGPGDGEVALFVISAGPNGTIETPFTQPVASARPGGDDIVCRIR